MPEAIVASDDGAVRIIRMNRPEKKNAITLSMYAAMTQALHDAETADAVRCIVLTGAPGMFSAGSDIGEFLATGDDGLRQPILDFLHAWAQSQKPVVAAVGGLAVGIGTTLLLHCDHVVAAADATFSTPFLKLALVPEAASTLLMPLRMGYARAFSLLVMGRPLSAAAAREAGLVNTVTDAASVEAVALKAAQEIAVLPAGAVAVARALMRGRLDDVVRQIDTEAMHFKDRLRSDEARAAFAAFLQRNK